MNGKIENRSKTKDISPEMKAKLESVHCVNCHRWVGYYAVLEGTVVFHCRKCKCYTIIDVHREEVDNNAPSEIK